VFQRVAGVKENGAIVHSKGDWGILPTPKKSNRKFSEFKDDTDESHVGAIDQN